MLTKHQAKLIKSLRNKKDRDEEGLFLVEGAKSVIELLNSDFKIDFLLATKEFLGKNKNLIKDIDGEILSQSELEKVGTLETNDSAIAVVKQKNNVDFNVKNEILIALDEVKDPGNLGTIIRIADWYGINKIVLSKNSVDFYNPKVISGSMGSFTRVSVFYTDLKDFLSKQKLPVFGAYLNGKDVHKTVFPDAGTLLMGNESKGISKELEKFVTEKINIPSYGKAESLNVAIATAVILDNWKK